MCVASGLSPSPRKHGSSLLGRSPPHHHAEQWRLSVRAQRSGGASDSSTTTSSSSSSSGSSSSSSSRRFYATTTSGCEALLLQEIRSLPEVKQAKAGKLCVTFSGTALTGFAAVLQLRTSLKVCEVLAESPAGERIKSPEALYSFAKEAVPWSDVLSSRHNTIRVESVLGAVDSSLSHSHFSALTVKNAIVDSVRDRTNDRPTVDVINPDVPFLVYLHNGACTIYRVWSGAASMHKRGYRGGDATATHKASLRETTAASLLLAAGYNHQTAPLRVLVDPMCGSGSIAVEAALMYCNVAPGLIRYQDGAAAPSATHFVDVDQDAWRRALEEAKAVDGRRSNNMLTAEKQNGPIFANDVDRGALALAEDAARRARVDHLISFSLGDAARLRLPTQLVDKGVVCVTNPPWALRLEEGSSESWASLGSFSRTNLGTPGSDLWVLAGNPELLQHLDLDAPPLGFLAMNAANVDMRLLHYQLSRPLGPPSPSPPRIAD